MFSYVVGHFNDISKTVKYKYFKGKLTIYNVYNSTKSNLVSYIYTVKIVMDKMVTYCKMHVLLSK